MGADASKLKRSSLQANKQIGNRSSSSGSTLNGVDDASSATLAQSETTSLSRNGSTQSLDVGVSVDDLFASFNGTMVEEEDVFDASMHDLGIEKVATVSMIEVALAQYQLVENAADILNLPLDYAYLLLEAVNFDKDLLLSQFFSAKADALLLTAGVRIDGASLAERQAQRLLVTSLLTDSRFLSREAAGAGGPPIAPPLPPGKEVRGGGFWSSTLLQERDGVLAEYCSRKVPTSIGVTALYDKVGQEFGWQLAFLLLYYFRNDVTLTARKLKNMQDIPDHILNEYDESSDDRIRAWDEATVTKLAVRYQALIYRPDVAWDSEKEKEKSSEKEEESKATENENTTERELSSAVQVEAGEHSSVLLRSAQSDMADDNDDNSDDNGVLNNLAVPTIASTSRRSSRRRSSASRSPRPTSPAPVPAALSPRPTSPAPVPPLSLSGRKKRSGRRHRPPPSVIAPDPPVVRELSEVEADIQRVTEARVELAERLAAREAELRGKPKTDHELRFFMTTGLAVSEMDDTLAQLDAEHARIVNVTNSQRQQLDSLKDVSENTKKDVSENTNKDVAENTNVSKNTDNDHSESHAIALLDATDNRGTASDHPEQETIASDHQPVASDEITCEICFCDYERAEMGSLACGHLFCRHCYAVHLKTALDSGKAAARCMYAGCQTAVSPLDWYRLCDAPSDDDANASTTSGPSRAFMLYRQRALGLFVDNSKTACWCSNPRGSCDRAIYWPRVRANEDSIVECECGWQFCWKCAEPPHAPASCDQVETWNKDSGNLAHAAWLVKNTKNCPGCRVAIEKNEGCLHMTCVRCGAEWCWICLAQWSTHTDYFSCNKPEVKSTRTDRRARAIEQHQFHKRAVEAVKFRSVMFRMLALRLDRAGLLGSVITSAVDTVLSCHSLLAWSCVLSVSLPDLESELMDMTLATVRVFTDRLYQRALQCCSTEFHEKEWIQKQNALSAVKALNSVVNRHHEELVTSLSSGAMFETAGGKSVKRSKKKSDDNDAEDPQGGQYALNSTTSRIRRLLNVVRPRPRHEDVFADDANALYVVDHFDLDNSDSFQYEYDSDPEAVYY